MRSQIPEKIVSLHLPDIERAVVAGGGSLELAGVRQAGDTDVVTDQERNINHLLASDSQKWHQRENIFHRKDGTPFVKISVHDTDEQFDIWPHWYNHARDEGDRLMYVDELIEQSWQHPLGFYVVHREFTIHMKAYSPRQKDKMDVRRNDQFVENGY